MSLDAIRWALDQPVKAATKLVLVVMADCVNAEGGKALCWPSYRFITTRTGLNLKTVEAAVSRLKELGQIVDTGTRRGETGKVVVYRLNTPENGVVTPGPQLIDEAIEEAFNPPKNGAVEPPPTEEVMTPVLEVNDPSLGDQSPQFRRLIPPKQGYGIRKKQEGTGKESGSRAPPPDLPDIPPQLLLDYMAVRKAKRAGPLSPTAIAGLRREAGKAHLTLEQAITACCEFGWQGFNAGWYADRTGTPRNGQAAKNTNGHSGSTTRAARMAEAVPGLVAKPKNGKDFIETEVRDVTPRRLG